MQVAGRFCALVSNESGRMHDMPDSPPESGHMMKAPVSNTPSGRLTARPAAYAFLAAALMAVLAPGAFGQSQPQKGTGSLTLGFEVRAWLPSLFDGMIKIPHPDHEGTEIGFDRDLDITSSPEILEIGFNVGDVRYGKIMFTWCDYSVTGNKILIRDLWYNGVRFNGPQTDGFGETVHSEFEFSFHRVTIQTIQNFAGSYFIGIDIGVVLFDFKGELRRRTFMTPDAEATPSRSAKADATLTYTGLFAEFELGEYFKLSVGLAGVFFQTTKTDVRLTEFYMRLDFILAQFLVIGLGYRFQSVDATIDLSGSDDGSLEMQTQGILLAAGIKF